MIKRRIVKSPFTKEEREGIFVSIESARKRRTLKNNKDKEYMENKDNQTETEFKEDLRQSMYEDIKYTPCGCDICIREHKSFTDNEEQWLEGRWQDELERRNIVPMTNEEMEAWLKELNIKVGEKSLRRKDGTVK